MKIIEQDIPGLVRKVLQLERDLNALRSERRAPATSIGSGTLTIDGGDVVMLDTDGSVIFRLGAQTFNDRGISIYRETGTPVLEVAKPNSSAVQSWRMKDSGGNTIVGESGFGSGLGRPRLPCHPFPTATPAWGTYGAEVSTTSGSFTTLFAVQDRRQNPLWAPAFQVKCSDATTAAEVQVLNVGTGTPLVEFGAGTWLGSRAAGSTSYVELAPALNVPGSVDARYRFEIQVRRTAGAGTVTIAVPESIGA